jgi:tRNA A37 N6-isopentenylltransferase MiaA
MNMERHEEEEKTKKEEPIVIVIIGSTGCGKSQLAVELATALDGEIVNADAMQVLSTYRNSLKVYKLYKGLDIATNKITIEETKGVKHHLLGILDISETQYNSTKYVHDAQLVVSCSLMP